MRFPLIKSRKKKVPPVFPCKCFVYWFLNFCYLVDFLVYMISSLVSDILCSTNMCAHLAMGIHLGSGDLLWHMGSTAYFPFEWLHD